ncbi:MAG: hypothetical protein GX137_06540 [Thermoplasmatales archaeon]|nr:hypothetical protein [Thermoplasmatales archaeon]
MATISFKRSLVIRNEEEARRLMDAIDAADARGPLEIRDFTAELEAGKEFVKRGPRR